MINIDELKKKIIYRSNYRGTKEMDKLLGKFVKKYIDLRRYIREGISKFAKEVKNKKYPSKKYSY